MEGLGASGHPTGSSSGWGETDPAQISGICQGQPGFWGPKDGRQRLAEETDGMDGEQTAAGH